MTSAPWRKNPLDYVLGPLNRDDFFANYHESKAIVINRDEPGRYSDLLSIARIDELLNAIDLDGEQVDMARAEPPVSRDHFLFPGGGADRAAISDLYRDGATLILPQLHQLDATLKDFCRSLESILSCHVQTNIYLTPPNSQGFRTHYDDHDVFVLQIEGEKEWRLYNTPIENPYRGEGFQSGAHEIGEPVERFILKAGESAYVPRGLVHDASTSGSGDSLHITVGLIVKTWADLMLEAVSEVALEHPGFRRSLPAGFARDDYDRADAEKHFKSLVQDLSDKLELDSAMDLFTDNFIRSRQPDSTGAIVRRAAPFESGAKFRLRPLAPWRLAENAEKEALVLITAGGELTFPLAAEPAIQAVLDGGQISLDSFSALEAKDAQDSLNKLYAFGVVEPV
ncbi:MAG: hypothetical protein CMF74_10660 [Maricaulis sp.]|nr:hypothetical protein [Maricaulis sp.]